MKDISNKQIQATLTVKKSEMEERLTQLISEDPFQDKERLVDNASSDTEAREEIGHERIEALREELVKDIQLVENALSRLAAGKYGQCENCKKSINGERLKIFPEAEFCIICEEKKENV